MADSVHHPAHYNMGKIEVIEIIEDQYLDFHLGNAVKYICRAEKKDKAKTIEDLEKAVWYLRRSIELMKAKRESRPPKRPNAMDDAFSAKDASTSVTNSTPMDTAPNVSRASSPLTPAPGEKKPIRDLLLRPLTNVNGAIKPPETKTTPVEYPPCRMCGDDSGRLLHNGICLKCHDQWSHM